MWLPEVQWAEVVRAIEGVSRTNKESSGVNVTVGKVKVRQVVVRGVVKRPIGEKVEGVVVNLWVFYFGKSSMWHIHIEPGCLSYGKVIWLWESVPYLFLEWFEG